MRYPLLDPLRGIAAVWVFAHHLVCSFDAEAAPGLLRLGYFGVPMFFVISGYCLTAAGRRPGGAREPRARRNGSCTGAGGACSRRSGPRWV